MPSSSTEKFANQMRSEAVDRIFAAKKKKMANMVFFSFIVPATFGPNLADSVDSIFKQQRAFPSSKHEGKVREFKKVMQT